METRLQYRKKNHIDIFVYKPVSFQLKTYCQTFLVKNLAETNLKPTHCFEQQSNNPFKCNTRQPIVHAMVCWSEDNQQPLSIVFKLRLVRVGAQQVIVGYPAKS